MKPRAPIIYSSELEESSNSSNATGTYIIYGDRVATSKHNSILIQDASSSLSSPTCSSSISSYSYSPSSRASTTSPPYTYHHKFYKQKKKKKPPRADDEPSATSTSADTNAEAELENLLRKYLHNCNYAAIESLWIRMNVAQQSNYIIKQLEVLRRPVVEMFPEAADFLTHVLPLTSTALRNWTIRELERIKLETNYKEILSCIVEVLFKLETNATAAATSTTSSSTFHHHRNSAGTGSTGFRRV